MNKNAPLYISLIALVASAAAVFMSTNPQPAAPQPAANADTASVEETLNNNPEIIINAMRNYEQKMRDEAAANAQKLITDNIEAVNNDPDTPVIGNPDGTITLVEFFDFSCGYCHRLYPTLKNIIAKNPDVKVLGKMMAFVSQSSDYAARAALAANEQGKYTEMYDALFTSEGPLTEESINAAAGKIGLDMAKFNADVNSDKVKNTMSNFSSLAQKIQVNGVPSMILNGKMLQTLDESVIQNAIDELKK